MKVIVAGSGPAGVSAAKGLLERGCDVILLDAGNTLEPEKQAILQRIQQNNNRHESPKLRHHANGKNSIKLPYGSNFIYDGVNDYFSWETRHCYFKPSFAKGGLSNVWGSAVVQHSEQDVAHWPAACRNLSAYYTMLTNWMGRYFTDDTSSVLSQQARHLKQKWDKQRQTLMERGFTHHQAVLATDLANCRFCGACQHGCPYGLIYNSCHHLDKLREYPNFSYMSDVVVENFHELNQQVILYVNDKKHKRVKKLEADRLFVACGSGISSLLYLRALNQPGKKLRLKDSQHFMLPCMLDKRFDGVMQEALHTLCQLNLSVSHSSVSRHPVFMQIYTYMDHYLLEMQHKCKSLYPVIKKIAANWIERMIVIQGYIDSRESNELIIQYQPSGHYVIREQRVNHVSSTIKNVMRHLKQHSNMLSLRPWRLLHLQSVTGQSNHVGSSLPMSDNPQGDEVDIWGKPVMFERVHFVDGSVLPSIPAGPITLTIMANAYRIAKETPL